MILCLAVFFFLTPASQAVELQDNLINKSRPRDNTAGPPRFWA